MSTESNDNTTAPGNSSVPAGWYPDEVGGSRWWDGTQWTEHYHPATPQTPAPAEMPAQPKKKRTGLIVGLSVGAAVVLVGVIALGAWTVNTALGQFSEINPDPAIVQDDDPFDEPETSDEPELPGFDGVFEEREQFFIDQQLPLDGSMLKAVTPAQKQFIAEMQQRYADRGLTWNEQDESISLALTADACENSILNQHRVDEYLVRTHAATSPLILQMTEGLDEASRIGAVNGAMQIAVTGVGYLCPADAPAWSQALETIGDSW